MDILEIINKKRRSKKLSAEEIKYFVDGVCGGLIKDYQATSLLMTICINGMDYEETYNLTNCMAHSGKILDLSDVGNCVDKHSTGGVSDTTTLVIVPILASLGVKVAKMSGRSLGFTGGTADKMEVFKGYKTEISTDEFKDLIKKDNASIISQSGEFALADKILYKLRSDSGTVENISLIASSIMSKKIACGAKILILDCKYGSGAFMKTISDAEKLARTMVKIGELAGIRVCAVLSSMEKPLTNYIGNNFEVYSALRVLNGEKNDLRTLAAFLASKALLLDKKCETSKEAQSMIDEVIENKTAIKKLAQIVKAQGGSIEFIEKPELLLKVNNKLSVVSEQTGYVTELNTSEIGNLSHQLQYVNDKFVRQDNVGVVLNKTLGDHVNCGDILATIYYNDCKDVDEFSIKLKGCYKFGSEKVSVKLIDEVIE